MVSFTGTVGASDLQWPQCLGTFDEDSCRFFLRELGSEIVQFYPFSVGIEEVYARILESYGNHGISDALSVLQELLEDDSAALGCGDDGDVWRSWRHSWRHRNDDHHSPYSPQLKGHMLPVPTPIRIRLLKSANFLAIHSSCGEDIRSAHASVDTDTPSRQESTRADCSPASHVLTINSHLPSRCSQKANIHLPRHLLATPTTKFPFPQCLINSQTSIPIVTGGGKDSEVDFHDYVRDERDRFDLGNSRPLSERPSVRKSRTIDSFSDFCGSSSPTAVTDGIVHLIGAELSIAYLKNDGMPQERCTRHREARIMNGTLFQARNRSERLPVKVVTEGSPENLSAQSTKQLQYENWIHNLRTRFHSDHKYSYLKNRKHFISPKCILSAAKKHSPAMSFSTKHDYDQQQMPQALLPLVYSADGTAKLANKPLPLSPADAGYRTSVTSETQRVFFHLPQSSQASPTTSKTSSGVGRFVQKLEFDGLVSATMSGPQELSPEAMQSSQNSQSNVSTNSPPPISPLLVSTAKRNPYNQNRSETAIAPASQSAYNQQQANISSTEWPFRSQLDPSTRSHSWRNPSLEDHRCSLEGSGVDVFPSPDERRDMPNEDRGRRSTTPGSPIRSANQTSLPKPTRKRSRSPVKRFLGMVKSTSTNQISPRNSASEKDLSPASNQKNKWKELSHKIRHGFLQLEQEDHMEQYQGIALLTTPQRVRPQPVISLDTAVQSRTYQELELLLVDNANTFLMEEYEHDRITRDSILQAKRAWAARNRPRVLEFVYDMQTQHEIIIRNLRTISLYGEYSEDMVKLNSVLQQWKNMIREWSVKTLCMPDNIIRRWLHDARRVLELLGANPKAMTCMDNLTISVYQVIRNKEHARAQLRNVSNSSTATIHQRSYSDGDSYRVFQSGLGTMPTPARWDAPPMPAFHSYVNGQQKKASTRGSAHISTRPTVTTDNGTNKQHSPSPRFLPREKNAARFVFD